MDVFTGVIIIDYGLVFYTLFMDLFLTNKQLFTLQDVN